MHAYGPLKRQSSSLVLSGLTALFGVAASVLGCASAPKAPRSVSVHSQPLYEVTWPGQTKKVFLLGSFHYRRPEEAGLDRSVWDALESSEVLWTEDGEADSPEGGPSLVETLPSTELEKFRTNIKKTFYEMPNGLEEASPFMALGWVYAARAQLNGYFYYHGVDSALVRAAHRRKMSIRGLEDRAAFVEAAGPEFFAQAVLQGSEYLSKPIEESFRPSEARSSFIGPVLLTQRDKVFAEALQAIRGGTHLAVVGMAHLYGENSLVERLRSSGAQIRPIAASGVRTPDPRLKADDTSEGSRFVGRLVEAEASFFRPPSPMRAASFEEQPVKSLKEVSWRGPAMPFHLFAAELDSGVPEHLVKTSAPADALVSLLSAFNLDLSEFEAAEMADGMFRFTGDERVVLAKSIAGRKCFYMTVAIIVGAPTDHDHRPEMAYEFVSSLRLVETSTSATPN